ncbi:MAG: hypothetical protein HOY79_17795 [Streptomyces sp.]|nr:hypothetical protein [Streptomyces sp.]
MATKTVETCRRCSGTGIWFGRGWCFRCQGVGRVTITRYSAQEKADFMVHWERRMAALEVIKAFAARLDESLGLTRASGDAHVSLSVWGFNRLEESEPERFTKMLDSLDEGRVYDVVRALSDYFKQQAAKEASS